MTTQKTSRWLTLPLVAALLFTASAVWAQAGRGPGRFGPPGDGGRGGFGPGPRLLFGPVAEQLDLSNEQRETIHGILEQQHEIAEPWREDLDRLETDLEAAIEAEPFDEEAVRAIARQVADVRVEMAVARARTAQEVRSVLTPAQRETLGELRAKRAEFRRHGIGSRGRGQFRGGPGGDGGQGR